MYLYYIQYLFDDNLHLTEQNQFYLNYILQVSGWRDAYNAAEKLLNIDYGVYSLKGLEIVINELQNVYNLWLKKDSDVSRRLSEVIHMVEKKINVKMPDRNNE